MDVNEDIVMAWLEIKGFFLRRRLRYDLSDGRWSSVGDVDLLGWNPRESRRVALSVTAWMTQNISPSHLKQGTQAHRTLSNMASKSAERVIRDAFGISNQESYERWWAVGRLGPRSKDVVIEMAQRDFGISRVIEFSEIMADMVRFVREKHKWLPLESETLQTLRALEWCDLLSSAASG